MLGRLEDVRQVEAKYPALLFKQQLTAFLEKIYGMIRDNLKKEISPLIGLCIQVNLAIPVENGTWIPILDSSTTPHFYSCVCIGCPHN